MYINLSKAILQPASTFTHWTCIAQTWIDHLNTSTMPQWIINQKQDNSYWYWYWCFNHNIWPFTLIDDEVFFYFFTEYLYSLKHIVFCNSESMNWTSEHGYDAFVSDDQVHTLAMVVSMLFHHCHSESLLRNMEYMLLSNQNSWNTNPA